MNPKVKNFKLRPQKEKEQSRKTSNSFIGSKLSKRTSKVQKAHPYFDRRYQKRHKPKNLLRSSKLPKISKLGLKLYLRKGKKNLISQSKRTCYNQYYKQLESPEIKTYRRSLEKNRKRGRLIKGSILTTQDESLETYSADPFFRKNKESRFPSLEGRTFCFEDTFEDLLNISGLHDRSRELEEKNLGEEIEPGLELEKYDFINRSKKFSILDLDSFREEAFEKTTNPDNKLKQSMKVFQGLFNKESLEHYYIEANFIANQNFQTLKRNLKINDVLKMLLTLLQYEILQDLESLHSTFITILKSIKEIIEGKIKIKKKENTLLKCCKVLSNHIQNKIIIGPKICWQVLETFEDLGKAVEDQNKEIQVMITKINLEFLSGLLTSLHKKKVVEFGSAHFKSYKGQLASVFQKCLYNLGENFQDPILIHFLKEIKYIVYFFAVEGWSTEFEYPDFQKEFFVDCLTICFNFTISTKIDTLTQKIIEKNDEINQNEEKMKFLSLSNCFFGYFDSYFRMITSFASPVDLGQPFDQKLVKLMECWGEAFLKILIPIQQKLVILEGVLNQMSMLIYQVLTNFSPIELDKLTMELLEQMVRTITQLIKERKSDLAKIRYTKLIRPAFGELLKRYCLVDSRSFLTKQYFAKISREILKFLRMMDNLKEERKKKKPANKK